MGTRSRVDNRLDESAAGRPDCDLDGRTRPQPVTHRPDPSTHRSAGEIETLRDDVDLVALGDHAEDLYVEAEQGIGRGSTIVRGIR